MTLDEQSMVGSEEVKRSEIARARKRRVLFVIGSLALGGAERHVASIATGLRSRGWECAVFALSPSGPLAQQLIDAEIVIMGPQLPGSVERLMSERAAAWSKLIIGQFLLAKYLLLHRGTITHFFLPAAYIFGGLTAWAVDAHPRIMSRRSLNRYQLKHPVYAKIERWLHPRMDRLLGNSMAVVRELEAETSGRPPICLIYNGIDKSALDGRMSKSKARAMLGVHEAALVMVIVANLIPYKGYADLIRALAGISPQLPPEWRLLCVGRDDGILKDLGDLAEAQGIGSNIIWLGARLDVQNIFSAADIAVSASHEEGFSNAVLEAMLAGLPMVVTGVGGNAEAVVDGVTGYVVPPQQPAMLGGAILKVARDPLRAEMGARGQQRVIEHFSTESCLNAYEALYEELP